jgi:hypothetical protein|tara:strand:- start:1301 stop:1972 length:672 start_codon:yes stop_codon:yes gene_type:complete
MKIKVVSTWNNKLFKEYAHRFQSTYNWPFELEIYNEDEGMYDEIPTLKKFVDRNKVDIPLSFQKDAVRFSYKVYAYTQAILTTRDCDGLIFIDADSVFYKKIDEAWVKKHLHREDCMITYLERPTYSECGFMYFNMKHNFIKQFAIDMRKMYDDNLLFKEDEQHDSFIFDIVRTKFEEDYGVENYDIGDGRVGHVQARSILGNIYDHTKGSRKKTGKSKESRL